MKWIIAVVLLVSVGIGYAAYGSIFAGIGAAVGFWTLVMSGPRTPSASPQTKVPPWD